MARTAPVKMQAAAVATLLALNSQPVGGRCRVPFDARERAVAARDRINGDASGVRATLV